MQDEVPIGVAHLCVVAIGDQQVVAGQVSVDVALRVHVLQRSRNVLHDLQPRRPAAKETKAAAGLHGQTPHNQADALPAPLVNNRIKTDQKYGMQA